MGAILFPHVFLLEDDPGHAVLIKRALGDVCGEVVHVSSVAEGIAALSSQSFDLIVTDLNLPDSRDVTHVETLHQRRPETPIVVLTSSTSLKDGVTAMKLGARDFIVKTFDRDFREVLNLSLVRLHGAIVLEAEKRRLQREMEVLRIAIENGDEGLAVVDPTGEVLYANSAFRAFCARCGGGGGLVSLFSARVHKGAALAASVREKLQGLPHGGVWTTELTFLDDKEAAFDLSLSAVETRAPAADHTVRELVVWVRDRSELKRRERFQREILSTTTHDLKGPLGAILLSAELLRDTAGGVGKTSELALRIGSSAQGALHLIDEFLSARRIQEGSLILRPAPHRVSDLLTDAVADYTTIAAARRITLTIRDDTPAGANVVVDRMGFVRVIGNLVSNALKFTPANGEVAVAARASGGDVTVSVRDTGSGMEPAEVQRVFERFSRLEKHREVEGSGLGLFVVRSVVSAHGGEIEVTSTAGRGTTIEVTFPAAPPVNERGELISLDFT